MTGEYTFVTAERQNELTRLIQGQLSAAAPTRIVATPEEALLTARDREIASDMAQNSPTK
jgi:hypothetical protein